MAGLIGKALRLPKAAVLPWLSARIAQRDRDSGVVEGFAYGFDPFAFAAFGACMIEPEEDQHAHVVTLWTGAGAFDQPWNGIYRVSWGDDTFKLYWLNTGDRGPYFALVGRERARAVAFFEAACRFNDAPRDEILVFHAGNFTKDERLLQSIADSSFETLILPEDEKNEVTSDIPRFFASKERYARYAIPWKRGVLFIGPPGNGKTHAAKAIVNTAKVPCIYVRSFDLPHNVFPGQGVAMVFERARRIAPCVMVLEDLDSLIHDLNRAYFLNELDGFDRNDGILVLATTNHPERIDPAIIDRPSRFDRKYSFGLPAQEQRRAYIEQWNVTLDNELQLSADDVAHIADTTEGFSYAYIKELFVSSLISWAGSDGTRFGGLLGKHVDVLRGQLASYAMETPPPLSEQLPAAGFAVSRAMMHGMLPPNLYRYGP